MTNILDIRIQVLPTTSLDVDGIFLSVQTPNPVQNTFNNQ